MSFLTTNQIKEQLSYSYVHAIAAKAGFCCTKGPDPDMDKTDVVIWATGQLAPDSNLDSPRLEVQLKATATKLVRRNGFISFTLDAVTYEKLRRRRATPIILVVYQMPDQKDRWLSQTENGLTHRRCAYWLHLYNMPPSRNKAKQVVKIPAGQVFTPDSLEDLMIKASREELQP